MGNLPRRYGTPALLSAEIPEPGGAPVRARLLAENLAAFRDTNGRAALVRENCPHRGASRYFGRNKNAAIRCVYHGRAFDAGVLAGPGHGRRSCGAGGVRPGARPGPAAAAPR